MQSEYNIPGYDPDLLKVADEIKAEFYPEPSYGIGDVVTHRNGHAVRIVSGSYWVGEGALRRLSNAWRWHPVDKDGNQIGEEVGGYGSDLLDPKAA